MIVLRKPLISEKSMKLVESNFYTFLVDKDATKEMISKIVAKKFGVEVTSVATVNIKPKIKMQRRVRKHYQVSGFKKAIVGIKKGQKIALFETPKEDEVTVTTGESEPVVMKEKRDILRRTKVRVEKGNVGGSPTTQRKVITGK